MSIIAAIERLQVLIARSQSTSLRIMMEIGKTQVTRKEIEQEIGLEKGLFQGTGH